LRWRGGREGGRGGGIFVLTFLNTLITKQIYHTLVVPHFKFKLDAISQGPKNSPFLGPNPLPLAHVMYLPASKTSRTGPYKS
jgi:hypothetical protein